MAAPQRLRVTHPQGAYEVVAGEGALAAATAEVLAWCRNRTCFVVTTPRVWSLHGASLAPLLASASDVHRLEVPEGEAAKRLDVAGDLWERMLEAGGKRDSRLVAFGGGSVGDLGGFAAACFLRGIAVYQVPTTLLAQVDASVGGKTAIDLPGGKNTVGAFHQPAGVIADVDLLATLPDPELRAGLVEVVKMAATLDVACFRRLEAVFDALLARRGDALSEAVVAAIEMKRRVVEADPWEGDSRRLLNFGHTLGHALEAVAGYGALRHGEAVAHGMRFALILARRRGLDAEPAARIETLIARLEPPPLPELDREALMAAMSRDKKARRGGLAWVLPTAVGGAEIRQDVGWDEVEEALEGFV